MSAARVRDRAVLTRAARRTAADPPSSSGTAPPDLDHGPDAILRVEYVDLRMRWPVRSGTAGAVDIGGALVGASDGAVGAR
jgi:hypothetical protein